MVRGVCDALGEANGLMQLQNGLGRVQGTMQEWDRSTFGSVRRDLTKLRRELERVCGQSMGRGPSRTEKQLM